MIRPVKIKVCGITREEDVEIALRLGADYLGFIVYPDSPRGLSFEAAVELAKSVPGGRRVLVDVETPTDELSNRLDSGFDFYQIHAGLETGLATLAAWSGLVGRDRLWIAPRFGPDDDFPEAVLGFAETVLVDTYNKTQVGGTGKTGDWERFASLKKEHPMTNWILAGGLNPENALAAIAQTGTDHIDVNSGVEQAPGIKDHAKLEALFRALRPS